MKMSAEKKHIAYDSEMLTAIAEVEGRARRVFAKRFIYLKMK